MDLLFSKISKSTDLSTNTHKPREVSTSTPNWSLTPLPTFSGSPFPTPTFFPLPHSTLASPLPKGIFDPFQEFAFAPILFQGNHETIKTAFGIITPGSIAQETLLVDSTMGPTVFCLFWEEGDLQFTLTQPDGKEIPGYFNDKYFFYYGFSTEQIGTWTMSISGKSIPSNGSNYMIQVTSMVATGLDDFIEKKEYVSGELITISFAIDDNIAGGGGGGPRYILGASMQVTVEDPAKKQYSFMLYDDGLHRDGKADDGIYANEFHDTSLVGKYNFYLQISGTNNRAGELFARERFFSIEVK